VNEPNAWERQREENILHPTVMVDPLREHHDKLSAQQPEEEE